MSVIFPLFRQAMPKMTVNQLMLAAARAICAVPGSWHEDGRTHKTYGAGFA